MLLRSPHRDGQLHHTQASGIWCELLGTGELTRSVSANCRVEAELVHVVNESSPFFGQSADEVASSDFLLILMMSGIDETLHDMVHKQYEYNHEVMRWGCRFEPMIGWDEGHSCMTLDFDKLSEVVAVDAEIDIQTQSYGEDGEADRGDDDAKNCGSSPDQLNILDDAAKPAELRQVRCAHRESLTSGKGSVAYAGDDDERIEEFEQSLLPAAEQVHSEDGDGEAGGRQHNEDSTRTNSGSEDGGRYNMVATHLPFGPRLRVRSYRKKSGSVWGRHSHGVSGSSTETPVSLLRRRIRFRNHPLTRFASGLYYRALSTSWGLLLLWSVVCYYGAIALIAVVINFSVR